MRRLGFFAGMLFLFCVCGPVRADLIVHYTGDNTVADASGLGHDATLSGSVAYAAGVKGNGFQFTGGPQAVVGPVIPEIDPTNFTIAFFMNANTGGGLRLVADSSHGGNRGGSLNWDGFALQLLGNDRIDFAWGNGSSFPHVTSTLAVADNTFHHVAASFDGTSMLLYIDGSLDNSVVYTGTAMTSGRNFRLGRHDLLGRQFLGTLDDVRVYDEVLSSAAIANLSAVPEPNAIALLMAGVGCLLTQRRRR